MRGKVMEKPMGDSFASGRAWRLSGVDYEHRPSLKSSFGPAGEDEED